MTTINLSRHQPQTIRQRISYKFRVTIYAPSDLAAVSLSDEEAKDVAFASAPVYTGCPCFYRSTPEYARVDALALTKEDSVLVSDIFYFETNVNINDAYLIVITGAGVPNHPYLGRCWVTQGNTEVNMSSPSRPVSEQWVYAKLSPTDIIPAGH